MCNTMEIIDLRDEDLEVEDLIDKIFAYLLELENKNIESDESVKKVSTKTRNYSWEDKPHTIEIETFDDTDKQMYRKLYFNGEGDSNQTRYEYLCNNLNIAVWARSEIVGKCLHIFLRQIIDDRPEDRFLDYLDGDDEASSKKSIPDIVTTLSNMCDIYGHCHDVKKDGVYATTKLRGYKSESKIKRFIGDIDTWDIYRIGGELGLWTGCERYKNMKGCL